MNRSIRRVETISVWLSHHYRLLNDMCFDLNESPAERFMPKKKNIIVNIYNDIRKTTFRKTTSFIQTYRS